MGEEIATEVHKKIININALFWWSWSSFHSVNADDSPLVEATPMLKVKIYDIGQLQRGAISN